MSRTACLGETVSRAFKIYGNFIESKVVCCWMITLSLIISGVLGCGLIFFELETNPVKLFTPQDSEALTDQKQVTELFSLDYDHFVADRVYDLDQRRVSAVIYSKDLGNMLRKEQLEEVLVFNETVWSLTIEVERNYYSYNNLCARYNSACISNPILEYLPSIVNDDIIRIPYPNIIDESNTTENVESFLGGVRVTNNSVTYVDFMMISYYLKGGDADELSSLWEKAVRRYFAGSQFTYIDVAVITSDGLDQGQIDLLIDAIPYFVGSVFLVLVFSVISSLTPNDRVQNQPWPPCVAVLTIVLALLSGSGLLSACGVPCNQVISLVPLLALGLGLDDMFMLLSTWRCCYKDDTQDACSMTLGFAGVSIFTTTLTDILALASCTISPLPVVREFCIYALVILTFVFLYQFTIFAPCMVLNGYLQDDNRAGCLCCITVDDESENKMHFGVAFFIRKFNKIFEQWPFYVIIAIVYIVYISASVVGIGNVIIGPNVQNIAGDNSEENTYLKLTSQHAAVYGPSVSLIFTSELPYWEEDVYEMVDSLISDLESTDFVKSHTYTQCWLTEYYKYLTGLNIQINSKEAFMIYLSDHFLKIPQNSKFLLDINFTNEAISSSRCILVTENVGTSKAKGDMMLTLRGLTKLSQVEIRSQILLFAPDFIFYEQYVILVGQIIQVSVVASVWTILASFFLIPNAINSIFIFVSVESIITGITGFMIFWDVTLDPYSIIYLIISIGFSVDFSFHIAYAFNVIVFRKRGLTSVQCLGYSLGVFGYPSVQGAASSILAIVLLLASPGYIYRTFGKIIILAMTFGLLHSLIFFPPALLLVYKISKKVGMDFSSATNLQKPEKESYFLKTLLEDAPQTSLELPTRVSANALLF